MYQIISKILKVISVSMCCVFLFAGMVQAEETATDVLRPDIEKLTSILNDEALKGAEHQEDRRGKIMEIIEQRFSFRLMSQMILRKGWRKLTEAQQQEFVGLMTELLEHAYIGRLEEYSGGEFRFVEEKERANGTVDITTAITYNSEDVQVHYIMVNMDNDWQVYEVKIESFSLISTYSEQFQPIFRKEGYEGLATKIQELINELKQSADKT